jgi:peptidyl-prolyl isomerase G (cyclophilin G)
VGERKETEEEYDARLEREENERLATERKRELERLARQQEQEPPSTNGVRFKGTSLSLIFETLIHDTITGRGRMKFVDPELHRRR